MRVLLVWSVSGVWKIRDVVAIFQKRNPNEIFYTFVSLPKVMESDTTGRPSAIVRKFRTYSALRNLAWTMVLCIVDLSFFQWFFILWFLAFAIAIVLGFCVPYRGARRPALPWRCFAYGVGGLTATLLIWLFGFFALAICDLFRSPLIVEGRDFSEIRDSVPVQCRESIPESATEIHLYANLGILDDSWEYTCRISEDDFVRFSVERAFPLGTNVCLDANGNMSSDPYDDTTVWACGEEDCPTNFLSCTGIGPNGETSHCIFDRDAGKLYNSSEKR